MWSGERAFLSSMHSHHQSIRVFYTSIPTAGKPRLPDPSDSLSSVHHARGCEQKMRGTRNEKDQFSVRQFRPVSRASTKSGPKLLHSSSDGLSEPRRPTTIVALSWRDRMSDLCFSVQIRCVLYNNRKSFWRGSSLDLRQITDETTIGCRHPPLNHA